MAAPKVSNKPVNPGWFSRDIVYLSELPDEEVLQRLTPGKCDGYWDNVDPAETLALLQEVRTNGSIIQVLNHSDTASLAYPVRGLDGWIVAVIAIGGPKGRWTRERMAALRDELAQPVRQLERQLGYGPKSASRSRAQAGGQSAGAIQKR
jgi:DNA-binding IclR family transcriptional regulator